MTDAVLPGCESYAAPGGPRGVLVLHGFTGNPSSMRPLAESLAARGHTVSLPRLPGHGTSVEDLMNTSWVDWSGAALEAYDELAARCEDVAVVGLSMGGGLTALVAEERDPVACVFINPLVAPPSAELRQGLADLIGAGLTTIDAIGSDIKREGSTELSYDATPLECARSLFEGIEVVYEHLGDVRAPSLLLTSREDHVVTPDNGVALEERATGPVTRVWLEDSYHVATLDNDQALVERLAAEFIAGVSRCAASRATRSPTSPTSRACA